MARFFLTLYIQFLRIRQGIWRGWLEHAGWLSWGGLLFSGVVGWLVVVYPSLQLESQLSRELAALRQRVRVRENSVKALPARKSAAVKSADVTPAEGLAPQSLDFLALLERTIFLSGVVVEAIEPHIPVIENFWSKFSFKITARGSEIGLITLIDALLQLPNLITLDALEWQRITKEDGAYQLQLFFTLYHVPGRVVPPSPLPQLSLSQARIAVKGIQGGLAKGYPPGQNGQGGSVSDNPKINRVFDKQVSASISVVDWSCLELTFLGTITRQGVVYGLVRDPLHQIHQVKVGDQLGLAKSRITMIDRCKIETACPTDRLWRAACS